MSGDLDLDAELVAQLRLLEGWFASADEAEKADLATLHTSVRAGRDLDWLKKHDLHCIDSFAGRISVTVDPAALSQMAAPFAAQMEHLTRSMRQVAEAVAVPPEQAVEIDAAMRQWERRPLGERRQWADWTPAMFMRFRPDKTRVRHRPHGRRVSRPQRVRRTRSSSSSRGSPGSDADSSDLAPGRRRRA